MAKTYNRREVEELLGALERSAREVLEEARLAANEAQHSKFETYSRFKSKCDEFDTISILIEYRLKNMGAARGEDLEKKFTELTLFMLSTTLETSLKFLRILAGRDALPLGSRDMFLAELRNLHRVQEKMSGDSYATSLNDKTKSNIKVAEEILGIILDRAPSLLQLGKK
jgi:hypothetical protein